METFLEYGIDYRVNLTVTAKVNKATTQRAAGSNNCCNPQV